MSRPPEYENGAPQGPPNVYHPQPESVPSYEEYADPAVAHGWLNAYDETREMPVPPAVDEAYVPGPSRRKRSAGRRGKGRRSSAGVWGLVAPRGGAAHRHSPAPLKAAVVVGGVAVALMVGFSFSGAPSAPSGGVQGKEESAAPTASDSAGATASTAPGGVSAGRPSGVGVESSPAASPSPSVSPGRTTSGGVSREPSAGASVAGATAAPTPTVTASTPGRSRNNPGHGQGGSKGPKQP